MTHFEEVLHTLGGTNPTLREENENWALWNVVFPTPAAAVNAAYLYLKSRCPLKEATEANKVSWSKMSPSGKYDVVITPSSPFTKHLEQTREAFRGEKIATSSKLLFDNLLSSLEFRNTEEDPYFIEPKLTLEDGEGVDAIKFLTSWALNDQRHKANANITIIKAHGGIGKTTLCRVLCNKIRSKKSAFPIFIESAQWQAHLGPHFSMRDIWDIAISRTFEVPSRLLSNEMALRVLIREGIFVPVLDGFDELCLNPSNNQGPEEVIGQLLEMVSGEEGEESNARLIVTTRDSFWNSLVLPDDAELSVASLHGFSNDQKREYFIKRLKSAEERDTAQRLAGEISGKIYSDVRLEEVASERPEGVPFILDMIASYVHENPEPSRINPYVGDPLAPLLEAMCRRENVRQKLDIDYETQLVIFEEIFREFTENIPETALNEYISLVADKEDPAIWHRFKSHVFLRRRSDGDFECKYEVLKVYFIARFLAKELQRESSKAQRQKVAEILAKNSTGSTEVLDWLAGQLRLHPDTTVVNAFQHAKAIIASVDSPPQCRASGTALFNLLSKFVEGDDKSLRTTRLHALIGEAAVGLFQQIILSGPVRSYDLRGCRFTACTLSNVEFRNCIFDATTFFENCVFLGNLEFAGCEGHALVQFSACKTSPNAELVLCKLQGTTSPEEVRRKFAEEIATSALHKFKGQFGFASIQYRRRNSGLPPNNPLVKHVWDILQKKGIVARHSISNVSEGGFHIVDDGEIRRDVRIYLESGFAAHSIRAVIDALMTSLD